MSDIIKDPRMIGEADKYEVRFPFVYKNTKQTVIKPIHFKKPFGNYECKPENSRSRGSW